MSAKARFVATELAYGQRKEEYFSGTPGLVAVKMLLSVYASTSYEKDWALAVADVSTAFLYAEMKRRVYIELPEEDRRKEAGAYVGILRKALYGTRDAPQAWQQTFTCTTKTCGLQESAHQPGVYSTENLHAVTHVDDILCAGQRVKVEAFMKSLQKEYKMNFKILGRREGNGRVAWYLRRRITITDQGLTWTHSHRMIENLKIAWGKQGLNTVSYTHLTLPTKRIV